MVCIDSITVCPKSITLPKESWYYGIRAIVSGSEKSFCNKVKWRSDNCSVASVNERFGYIYTNNIGTAKIYAEATDGSGCQDCVTINVTEREPNQSYIFCVAGNALTVAVPDSSVNES